MPEIKKILTYKMRKVNKIAGLLLFGLLVCISGNQASAAEIMKQDVRTDQYIVKWGQDESLKGLFDSSTMYFQTGKWKITEAKLRLRMSASQLINRELSYLTISLDGQPVETISIPNTGKEEISHVINLPAERLVGGEIHSVTVEAYLRGQTTDACVDDSSISTWINLFGNSQVELQYEPQLFCEDIASFYQKFVSVEALNKSQSMIAAGEGAQDAVLTSMAHILTGFSQNAQGDCERIKTEKIRKEKDLEKYPYIIYINRYDLLPDYLVSVMSDLQKEYAQKSGVICLVEYKKTKVLLVTGQDDAAIKKAGDLLSNPILIPTLTKTQEFIDINKDYLTEDYEWEEYIPLTDYGAKIKGNFEQSISFNIDYPMNRRLAKSAQLKLNYRYSSNLNFDKSLLTVLINGIPVGSRKLTEEGADGTQEVFDIPEDINVAGSFTVETVFLLYPEDEWCELTPESIPWAYVADTSMLKWTTTENKEIFFDYYPFPFVREGKFNGVRILLPQNWDDGEIQTMAGILLTMGKWQKSNSGSLEVLTSPADGELDAVHIISIGNSKRNYLDTGKLKLDGNVGCAQLTLSAYGEGTHAVLLLTGKTDNDMQKNIKILGDFDNLWQAKGDLFYTDGKNVNSLYVRQPDLKIKSPEIIPLLEKPDSVPIVIVCSVLALILLAAAMILIKYGRKKDE